jgi:tRNA threonylcarbamoyladenosine biosynthesis protein TsaE
LNAAEQALRVATADAMEAHGAQLARARPLCGVVYLQGELGAGKTTFARGVLRALGIAGALRSPTYTLVEPYSFDGRTVLHFDLYRLVDGQELELIGARDCFAEAAFSMVEWPERGAGFIPPADLRLCIEYAGEQRRLIYDCCTRQGVQLSRYLAPISSDFE